MMETPGQPGSHMAMAQADPSQIKLICFLPLSFLDWLIILPVIKTKKNWRETTAEKGSLYLTSIFYLGFKICSPSSGASFTWGLELILLPCFLPGAGMLAPQINASNVFIVLRKQMPYIG